MNVRLYLDDAILRHLLSDTIVSYKKRNSAVRICFLFIDFSKPAKKTSIVALWSILSIALSEECFMKMITSLDKTYK